MAGAGARIRVAAVPKDRPVLVYDGDCAFCQRRVLHWRARTGERVEYAPYQEAAARYPEIPREAFASAVQFIGLDGTVASGAEAACRTLACAPWRGGPLWLYLHLPGAAALAEAVYRFVARHRGVNSNGSNR